MNKPILYTYRRCPYAMRARMALASSRIDYEPREILLSDKPSEMLEASPKGTVPVLVLADESVIDESYEIMKWALNQHDPCAWLPKDDAAWKLTNELVRENDTVFKKQLDAYKYASRTPNISIDVLRQNALPILRRLNNTLLTTDYLTGPQCGLADIALFPFVRQFRSVDDRWFDSAGVDSLLSWLKRHLESDIFAEIMTKNSRWRGSPTCGL